MAKEGYISILLISGTYLTGPYDKYCRYKWTLQVRYPVLFAYNMWRSSHWSL
jgi:hypothetical protein